MGYFENIVGTRSNASRLSICKNIVPQQSNDSSEGELISIIVIGIKKIDLNPPILGILLICRNVSNRYAILDGRMDNPLFFQRP